ncbi:MAG: hypothetical protein Tsb002_03170 [Wenzhouxiangellaceae bacterium]
MNDEDRELFRKAIGEVRRLDRDHLPIRPPPPPLEPVQRQLDEAAVLRELLNHAIDPSEWCSGEELQWHRPGLQRRILNRLKRGQYAVMDQLDLHHMNEQAATNAIIHFLEAAVASGYGCVRIIHGKGLRSRQMPVLKRLTGRLLPRLPMVLAFCSARQIDGGTGAVYVLLRQPKYTPGSR